MATRRKNSNQIKSNPLIKTIDLTPSNINGKLTFIKILYEGGFYFFILVLALKYKMLIHLNNI